MALISDYAHARARPHRRRLFARMFQAMVEAREREADRLIRAHLANLDPETLRMWGYDPQTLKPFGIPFEAPDADRHGTSPGSRTEQARHF